jgi:hypothetical protein
VWAVALCLKVKVVVEAVIFVALCCAFFHRFLGWFAASYLTALIGTKQGAFHFSCRSVALRLGMDENDIVIRDFVFKNPPGYKSDGFVHVQSMTVAFDLYSVYEAIRYGSSIKIHHFELAGVSVHIEKGTDGVGLNLWACLGSTNHEQAK